jgi:hypothetical protein
MNLENLLAVYVIAIALEFGHTHALPLNAMKRQYAGSLVRGPESARSNQPSMQMASNNKPGFFSNMGSRFSGLFNRGNRAPMQNPPLSQVRPSNAAASTIPQSNPPPVASRQSSQTGDTRPVVVWDPNPNQRNPATLSVNRASSPSNQGNINPPLSSNRGPSPQPNQGNPNQQLPSNYGPSPPYNQGHPSQQLSPNGGPSPQPNQQYPNINQQPTHNRGQLRNPQVNGNAFVYSTGERFSSG